MRMRIRHIGIIGLIGLIGLIGPIRAQEVTEPSALQGGSSEEFNGSRGSSSEEEVVTLPLIEQLEPEVTIHQSESVNRLLVSRSLGIDRKYENVANGYRIQVYSSNNQKVANKESADIAEKVRNLDLGIEVYRTYHAPFWRVRLGNYRTQAEANEVLSELTEILQKQLPEVFERGNIYIVHDEEVVIMQ